MNKLITFVLVILTTILYSQRNETWEEINFPDTLNPFAVNAQKEGILFASTGGSGSHYGTFRSFDEGLTWEEIYADSNFTPLFGSIQYSNNDILFIGTNDGIYRSFDDGNTFEKVYHDYPSGKLMFSNNNDLYTVGWDFILRSQDLGITWDTVCDMASTTIYYDMAFGNSGELYAVGIGWTSSHKGFYRSLDDGETWENIGITENSLHSIEINDEGTLIAGGFSANEVFKSYNKGETWIQCSNIFADIMKSYSSDLLIAGGNVNSNTGIWFSEDCGETWVDMFDETISSYPYIKEISISENNIIYLLSEDGFTQPTRKLYKSTSPIVSINNNSRIPESVIYPNPCNSVLRTSNITEYYGNFIVYDLFGRIVLQGKVMDKDIEVSMLKSGSYIIMFKSTENNLKLIFEKI